MRKIKVLMTILLVVTMLFSMSVFSLPVLAAGFEVQLGSVQGYRGETVTVPVYLKNVPSKGVNSCDFTVNYDTSILEAVEGGVTAGPITKNSSQTFDSIIDAKSGTIKFIFSDETGLGSEAVTSDGVFANIRFLIKQSALGNASKILMGDAVFGDTDLEYITASVESGAVSILEKQGYKVSGYIIPDLSYGIQAGELMKSGFNVQIAGTDKSAQTDKDGYFEVYTDNGLESCTLTIKKDGYLTREIIGVKLDNSVGNTRVSSLEAPTIMWVGDINNDNAINMSDVMEICTSFNATKNSSTYKSGYDLNKDDAVNMADIMALVKHFNKVSGDYK